MTAHRKLLDDIESHLAATGMSASYFGRLACGNSEVVARLRAGKRVWPETEMKLRAWMFANANTPLRRRRRTEAVS